MPELLTVKRSNLIEPPEPIRFQMDDGKLHELAASIRKDGIYHTLVCCPSFDEGNPQLKSGTYKDARAWIKKGGKLEIIDGHRRFVASAMADVDELPVAVFPTVGDGKFGIMLGANAFRQDVTPVEEGVQFIEVAEKHGWDMAQMVAAFGRNEDYINERSMFVKDNPDLIEPVAERKLKWSQAKAIAKCKDPRQRAYLIDQAVTHGASTRTLIYMVDQWKSASLIDAGGAAVHTPEHATEAVRAENPRCIYCERDDDPANMVELKVHSYHRRDLESLLVRIGLNRPARSTGA